MEPGWRSLDWRPVRANRFNRQKLTITDHRPVLLRIHLGCVLRPGRRKPQNALSACRSRSLVVIGGTPVLFGGIEGRFEPLNFRHEISCQLSVARCLGRLPRLV